MYNDKLINLIFPNQKYSYEYYENLYPARKENKILRFAPSPTGFLHTGSLYTALINYLFAYQNNGIFYLRIEDTDTKRTVTGSLEALKEQLHYFGIDYNNDEKYGPYLQSLRKDIYNAMIIRLLKEGKAYPCFLTEEEIEEIRTNQASKNLRTGIYKSFAKYRDISNEDAINKISNGESFVIRLKSEGSFDNFIEVSDELRGTLKLHENDSDIVILKKDGLPTYHFAHAVDDHFMFTTTVIRGEEWLTSLPIHYELFKVLGFKLPNYLHLDSIMKLDNGNKRKLSKRKDPEASVSYLMEMGFPKESIINYLLTLANSNYEEYLMTNKSNNFKAFKLDVSKMSSSGALFDFDKLNFISKESISYMDINYLVDSILSWASKYNNELYSLITSDEIKFKRIINIGRDAINPRKEFAHFDEILELIKPFYNEYYNKLELTLDYNQALINKVKDSFLKVSFNDEEAIWLQNIKARAFELGFAKNKKELNEKNLKYMFSDYMKIIRNLIFKRDNSPSLYDVLNILGLEEVKRRLEV